MSASSEKRTSFLNFFATGMILFWLLIAIGPFIWTVWGSFKVQGEEIAETKRVRLAQLKKQVSSGSYQPSTKALAKSLLAAG